jgi:hypothetical protein
MKTRILSLLSLSVMLAVSVSAQTLTVGQEKPGQLYSKTAEGQFVPVELNTNASPFLSGPLVELLTTLSTATNWGVATFGIYMPASDHQKAAYGCGAIALYNINPYMATGIGIDWLDNQVTMPSGQFQLQAPLKIGGDKGLVVTPFAFAGVATPVSGMGEENGSVVGIFGAGLDVKVYGGLGVFYAIEERTGQPALWNIAGVRFSKAL